MRISDWSSDVCSSDLLDEASRLRAEAEALLASYQAEANEAAEDSKKIVAHARAEAERLVAEAKIQAEEAIARRTRLAEAKISDAERAATDGQHGRASCRGRVGPYV